MKSVYWKSALRHRVYTLFLLLLVGLISFAFIARAVEYLVVDREIDRLAGYYRAIGSLAPRNETDYDVGKGAELVANSQYIALEDQRRTCSGVLQGLYNSDIDGFINFYADINRFRSMDIYIDDVLVYGMLTSKSFIPTGYQFIIKVDQVLAGYPEHAQEDRSIRLQWTPDNPDDLKGVYDSLEVGGRYFVKANFDDWVNGIIYTLRPLNESGLWWLPMEPGATVDLTAPYFVGLEEELRVTEENRQSMFVIATKDLSALPVVQEVSRSHYLAEGRWLNRADDIEKRHVCVVHRNFAEVRGLALGDTITLKLRDLKDGYDGYIDSGGDWEVWQDYETSTQEFEIVGLYGMIHAISTMRSTYMYIPDSSMPSGYGDSQEVLNKGFYSFILHSPRDINAFLAENQADLLAMGLVVTFVENGWEGFQISADPMKRSAALSAGVFTLVLVLALSLAAFIYLRQQRRNLAILRSLGVPKHIAVRQMLQPMALVGAVSIAVGGVAAWCYALGQAADTLASLQGPEGISPSTALSPLWLVGLVVGTWGLLLLFTHAGTVLTARRPVLELLQDMTGRAAGRGKAVADAKMEPVTEGQGLQPAPAIVSFNLGQAPAGANNFGFAQGARYVLRHIRRARLKSLLTVAVALCFILALGWMSWTMERNVAELDHLYRTIQVEAEIIKTNPSLYMPGGFIPRQRVDSILNSGFVQSAYLEATSTVTQASLIAQGWDGERTETGIALCAFDRPEQFFVNNGGDISVEYAEGWDESLFTRDWPEEETFPVLLPASMLARLGLHPGEEVMIFFKGTMDNYIIAGCYMGAVKGDDASPILMPLSVLRQVEGGGLLYSVAEFVLDPAKNRELPEFRAEMDLRFASGHAGTIALTFLLWDGELTNVVEPLEKNLQLMAVLFPVTVAVSVLIAAGLAVLLIFQTTKTAALLRILGTTRTRARAMLCWEQLVLCIVGLSLGLGALIILRQDLAAVLAGTAMLSAGLYLTGALVGALFSSISVTNRMPLELLQVKE